MNSPFVFHDGRWYLCPGFNRRPSARHLKVTLAALLEHHAPERILVLRPMTPAEVRLLMRYRDDFDAEAFALMCPTAEARIGEKKGKRPTTRRGRGAP
jgi:hypothetical protein